MWKTHTFGDDTSAVSKSSSLKVHENQSSGPEYHHLHQTHKVALPPELSHVGAGFPNRMLVALTQLVWDVLGMHM